MTRPNQANRIRGSDMQATQPEGQSVAPVAFTTEHLPPQQRLEAWNAAFGTLNEIRLTDPATAAPTRSMNWRLGGMVLGVNRVPDCRFHREPLLARRDALDHWVIRVLSEGRSLLRHAGFSASVGPGEPVLFSMDETWTTWWQGAEWVSITIPRDLHPQLSNGLAALPRGPLLGTGAALLAQLLLALPKQLGTATERDLPMLTELAQSMVAACLLPATPAPAANLDQSRKEQVRRAIRANIGSVRLTPERLATLVGVSRSALYRMFEAEGGVARYVQDLRLAFVHGALRDPAQAGRSIAEIAGDYGFPDPSVFTRSFRRAYGVSPRELRGTGPSPTPQAPQRQIRLTGSDLAASLYRGAA